MSDGLFSQNDTIEPEFPVMFNEERFREFRLHAFNRQALEIDKVTRLIGVPLMS